jgi:hypothetical protein
VKALAVVQVLVLVRVKANLADRAKALEAVKVQAKAKVKEKERAKVTQILGNQVHNQALICLEKPQEVRRVIPTAPVI